MTSSALISTESLKALLGQKNVKILDGSYGLPDDGLRIGDALDFDIDAVADPAAPLAHTLPSPDIFAAAVGAMGISNDDMVVVYDRAGMHMSAARVWWMFRVFGHDNVRILDGGRPAWVASGGALLPRRADVPAAAVFKADYRPRLFRNKNEILSNIDTQDFAVFDARDPSRYAGTAPEPRPGMSGGHIPGSANVPFAAMIDPASGRLKSPAAIRATLAQLGVEDITDTKPVAISCGSGVTACVVALALHEIGKPDAAVYGGSWAEWGQDPALPKSKGERA